MDKYRLYDTESDERKCHLNISHWLFYKVSMSNNINFFAPVW